jgi:hypothetical protein
MTKKVVFITGANKEIGYVYRPAILNLRKDRL